MERYVEYNGKKYPVAERTGALEKRIIAEHDSKLSELTEYERYKVLLSLFCGEEAFTEMFPNGEDESLDNMAEVVWHAKNAFNSRAKKLEQEQANDMVSEINVLAGSLANINKQFDAITQKVSMAQRRKK